MTMTKFPILYKKTSTGKIQTWEIWVEGNVMHSESGQLNGKKIKSEDTVREGKNIGKANETTPEEQALAEAKSRWEGKLKKGYVSNIEVAETGGVDEVIEGGFNPMLAKEFTELPYPFAVQPKLDGIRCAVTETSTWTRTRKPIRSVPHINHELGKYSDLFEKLDGELYNHKFKDDFEQITHIVNQKKGVAENYAIVQYHIYDIPSDKPFKDRIIDLQKLFTKIPNNSPLKLVPTRIVNNEEELAEAYDDFKNQGYEGLMARPLNGAYEYKRSKNLLKLKDFVDSEFKIVGGEEGRGKLQGHLGAFVCETEDGTKFKVKMSGETSYLKTYWENLDNYIGKMLTVKYQALTGKNNVPRFPVGKAIRDYE